MFHFWGINPPLDDTKLVELNYYENRLIFYHNNDAICIIKKKHILFIN